MITLVYGLGFGMVLVLIVVPALMAMQQDVARQVAALKRSLRAPALRGAMWPALALVLAWLGLAMGWVAVTGALNPQVAMALPGLAALPAMVAGFVLFLAGAAVLALGAFAVIAVAHLRHRQRETGNAP